VSSIDTVASRASIEARPLHVSERGAALTHLGRRSRDNLLLLDLAERVGEPPAPGEMPTELLAVWRDGRIVSIAALRPSLVLEPEVEPEALAALRPFLGSLGVGLLKSALPAADALWDHLVGQRRRRALVDRVETAYAVARDAARLVAARPGEAVRRASRSDLDAVVVAARESLREENRPDPFAGDPKGFRRWVRGRLARASVVESGGRVVFVGYADVQRPEGWLLQGVYTWPDVRRRGFGAVGVSALCERAFASGADHVQLAVVDGNEAGRRLYESLGFEPFSKLRTVLFA
jgi:RimJ/RimL family protein N-acetyltransferase